MQQGRYSCQGWPPVYRYAATLETQIWRRLRGVPTIQAANPGHGSEESRAELLAAGCGLLEAGQRGSSPHTSKPGHARERQL